MALTVLIHIANSDPILADMEELPDGNASHIVCTNARGKDGRPLHYIDEDATTFLFPWHRITFLEIYPGDEEQTDIETFYRN